jgi:hypothetical protein
VPVATCLREHFLGFVNEEECGAGEIPKVPDFIADLNLFCGEANAMEAFAAWLLRPP